MRMQYFTIPELPDKPMFRCDKLNASLQVSSCASMWLSVNQPNSQASPTSRCKGCSIGANHAGVKDASTSKITGNAMCARCHRTGSRLVGKHLCVSCWNRQREYLIGKNRRGVPPKHHPKLYEDAVKVMMDGVVFVIRLPLVASRLEIVVSAIRDHNKQITFGFTRGMDGIV